jgi:hypothetical protein
VWWIYIYIYIYILYIHTHIMQVRYFAATYCCGIIAIQTIIDGACSLRPHTLAAQGLIH